jgi:hypothetical protein
LQLQLSPHDYSGTLKALDGGAAVVGVKQAVNLRAAGFHQLGHSLLGNLLFFISLASWRAITALIAAAVTSS